LESAALGAAGIVLGGPLTALGASSARLKIEEPFHGAVLNHRQGKAVDGGLAIRVSGTAPAGDRVVVCGTWIRREIRRMSPKRAEMWCFHLQVPQQSIVFHRHPFSPPAV
jgi:hypothetical protein